MREFHAGSYDVAVIGAGHAGIEAALAAARLGCETAVFTINLDSVGNMPCNPAIGGTGKGHLVRELDALGGEMGKAADACCIQYRLLNRGKGPAVWSLRAQADRRRYQEYMKHALERQPRLHVRQGEVADLRVEDGAVSQVVLTTGAVYDVQAVILATGGVSYPATGSTGDGYAMAAELGHTIVAQEGSLVPLEAAGEDCPAMQGLSLRNVLVKLLSAKGKLLYQDFGELLFTHFGVSGPTVLSASCHLKSEGCRLLIDLKPALDESRLDDRIVRDLQMYQNRAMENALTDLLPRSMIPVVLRKLEIDPAMQANSLTKQKRRELVQLLKAFPVEIIGKRPVSEAIITSGGVKVSEIDPKTMESKLIKGLYFAGEIIDCDAYTGGFNLQIAWATAHAAAMAAGAYEEK